MAAPPIEVPCEPWTTPEEVRACCGSLDPAFDLTGSINFASAILYRLSGRQFPGICERTIWPCAGDNCGCGAGTTLGDWWWTWHAYPAWPVPNGTGNGFVNCGRCTNDCSLPALSLPTTINEIVEIVINGEVLPPEAYAIEAYRRLVRLDGHGWPCTNDLTGDPGDPGVWTVTYLQGKPVPLDGRAAASIFACQIALSRCGGENCLPQRLKEISRQGVDMAFADPMEFIGKGLTGIYEVDMWIESVNPGWATAYGGAGRLKRRSRVFRPDRRKGNTTFTG